MCISGISGTVRTYVNTGVYGCEFDWGRERETDWERACACAPADADDAGLIMPVLAREGWEA